VIPVGAEAAVVPAEVVNQFTDPTVPVGTFAVLMLKAADPEVPPVIVPFWVPRDTAEGPEFTVNVVTVEVVVLVVNVK
jgi:hypothetical protein